MASRRDGLHVCIQHAQSLTGERNRVGALLIDFLDNLKIKKEENLGQDMISYLSIPSIF